MPLNSDILTNQKLLEPYLLFWSRPFYSKPYESDFIQQTWVLRPPRAATKQNCINELGPNNYPCRANLKLAVKAK